MQISSTEVIFLIGLTSVIFLIAPLFLIIYISSYNRKKKKHLEEKEGLKSKFELELLKTHMEVKEQTMQTIAYDLHDNIGQLLSLTVITLNSIDLSNYDKAEKKIRAAEDLTKRCVKELRQLSKLLQGEELINKGLTGAIAFELEWLTKADLYKITFVKPNDASLPIRADNDIFIFRLFQEILNNTIKHAHATEINIFLQVANKNLTLTIKDNGIGFNVDEMIRQQQGMGISNIQKRVALINGKVKFESERGKGTVIIINAPYL